jgi:hypothetical protein
MRDSSAWHRFCFGTDLEQYESNDDIETIETNEETKRIALELRKWQLCNDLDIDDTTTNSQISIDNVNTNDNSIHHNDIEKTSPEVIIYPEAVPPTPSLLMQFDQVMTQRILAHNVDWLNIT